MFLLSNVLNGAQEASEIFLNPLAWYQDNGVTLIAGVRATAIDRAAQSVALADGSSVCYDQLIIATGSRPFVPRMDGLYTEEADGVMRSMKLKSGSWTDEKGNSANNPKGGTWSVSFIQSAK